MCNTCGCGETTDPEKKEEVVEEITENNEIEEKKIEETEEVKDDGESVE